VAQPLWPQTARMTKPRLNAEALAYLAACRRDLRYGAAQSEREIEVARRQWKAAKLDRFVERKRGSKDFER
jgi:hypothetical protein